MTTSIFRPMAVLAALLTLLTSGCSVTSLQHEGLSSATVQRDGKLSLSNNAEGLDGSKVGWGRFTPFAIPIVPIYIGGDESEQFMQLVKEALEIAGYTVTLDTSPADEVAESLKTAGYQVTKKPAISSQKLPVLKAVVKKMRYSNYTWLAPLVPTWGGVDTTLTLVNHQGEALWGETFDGSGFTFNFFNGYNIASQESMSEVLDKMVVSFGSDAFFLALRGTNHSVENGDGA